MKTDLQLQLEERTPGGISAVRASGKVPGVVYEPRGENNLVAVPLLTLQHAIAHGAQHHPINVKQGAKGKTRLALIKEIQRHAFSGEPIHVDFMLIQKNKPITLNVPIMVLGETDLMKQGYLMHLLMREVPVEAKPADVPAHFEVDVSKLKGGDAVTVGELKAPPGVTITGVADQQILTIGYPRVQAEEEVAAADEEQAAAPDAAETSETP